MRVIGRKNEIRELERCEKTKKSELVCVYGRRRVSKTYLVEQTYANIFHYKFLSKNAPKQVKSFDDYKAEKIELKKTEDMI
ncbi:MAG: hypothetical protein IKO61_04500 [Lachnospiraceae bacterium]|nr:hypothetical protein [Lachnospiraceae bacterium]